MDLHAKLSFIATQLSSSVADSAVIRWIRSDLLSIRFITALSEDYANEVRCLGVDVSLGRIGSARIKQVVGYRFHTLRRGDQSSKGHALWASEQHRLSAKGGERSNAKTKRGDKKSVYPTCGGRGHSADICPSSAQQATIAEEDSAPDAMFSRSTTWVMD